MILSVASPMKKWRLLGEDAMGNLIIADYSSGSSSLPLLAGSTLSCDFEVSPIAAEYIPTSLDFWLDHGTCFEQ